MNCIELFAGAGGLMLGLEEAGFHALLANEIHPHPCMTLRKNFPNTPIIEGSIKDFTGASLLAAAGYKKGQIKEIDLIAGGPPCQGFSTAGLKDPNDPRNTLIGDFIRIVNELRPRYFLMENVPGLLTLHKGELFKKVLKMFEATGYNFRYEVLRVADYGVPQMRKRLVVFGSRDGTAPMFPVKSHFLGYKNNDLFEIGKKKTVSAWDAISDLPMIEQDSEAVDYTEAPKNDYQKRMRRRSKKVLNHKTAKHRQETMDYYALIPTNGTFLDIPLELRKKKEGIQRWPLNGLARAITTEPTDFLHPILHRIPTVRETARIQSFPDSYEFCGQRTTGNKMRRLGYCSQTQQVGNAVPPLFAEALGIAIMDHIEKEAPIKRPKEAKTKLLKEACS